MQDVHLPWMKYPTQLLQIWVSTNSFISQLVVFNFCKKITYCCRSLTECITHDHPPNEAVRIVDAVIFVSFFFVTIFPSFFFFARWSPLKVDPISSSYDPIFVRRIWPTCKIRVCVTSPLSPPLVPVSVVVVVGWIRQGVRWGPEIKRVCGSCSIRKRCVLGMIWYLFVFCLFVSVFLVDLVLCVFFGFCLFCFVLRAMRGAGCPTIAQYRWPHDAPPPRFRPPPPPPSRKNKTEKRFDSYRGLSYYKHYSLLRSI